MNPATSPSTRLQILWTVDVEDYYMSPESIPVSTWNEGHYEDRVEIGCRKLLDLFATHNLHATWFFLGWVADRHPELVQAVAAQGHEIGTHTYDHRPAHKLSPREYEESLRRSCEALEAVTGKSVIGHRAPEWSLRRDMQWAFELLSERGFLYDSSVNPIATYLYGEKGAPRHPYLLKENPPLWEIPPASIALAGYGLPVGGGFFLRALPLAYMRRAIRRYNREGHPAIVYIHPWELDREHPLPPLPCKERWIHTWGLGSAERKLRALAAESVSQTLGEYVMSLSTGPQSA